METEQYLPSSSNFSILFNSPATIIALFILQLQIPLPDLKEQPIETSVPGLYIHCHNLYNYDYTTDITADEYMTYVSNLIS